MKISIESKKIYLSDSSANISFRNDCTTLSAQATLGRHSTALPKCDCNVIKCLLSPRLTPVLRVCACDLCASVGSVLCDEFIVAG